MYGADSVIAKTLWHTVVSLDLPPCGRAITGRYATGAHRRVLIARNFSWTSTGRVAFERTIISSLCSDFPQEIMAGGNSTHIQFNTAKWQKKTINVNQLTNFSLVTGILFTQLTVHRQIFNQT